MAKRKAEDFRPGEECFFCEDGGIARCKVLSISQDLEYFKANLEVLEVIQRTRFVITNDPLVVGRVLEVIKRTNMELAQANGGWVMIEDWSGQTVYPDLMVKK